jgi:hypothetical protein
VLRWTAPQLSHLNSPRRFLARFLEAGCKLAKDRQISAQVPDKKHASAFQGTLIIAAHKFLCENAIDDI